jgi:hypothetical protein
VVADCWADAGFAVVRDGTVVRVRRAGHERRLSTVPDPDSDRVLDAAAVRDALLYRVSRADGDRIADRHLGAALDDLRPSRRRRAAAAVGAWGAPVATAALVVVALALVGGVGSSADGGGPTYVDATPTATGTGTPDPQPDVADVPGLGPTGVTDLAALAAAHGRARPDSYGVWVDVERSAPDAGAVVRDVDLRVEGERYHAVVRVDRGPTTALEASVYGDGERRVVGVERNGQVTTRDLGPTETGPAGVDPDSLGAEGVRGWLAAPETRVAGVTEYEGTRVYRVVGVGAPPAAVGGVESYRVTALVTAEGFVVELVAEYELIRPERPERRFEWSYSPGPRRVVPPEWTEPNATGADD